MGRKPASDKRDRGSDPKPETPARPPRALDRNPPPGSGRQSRAFLRYVGRRIAQADQAPKTNSLRGFAPRETRQAVSSVSVAAGHQSASFSPSWKSSTLFPSGSAT